MPFTFDREYDGSLSLESAVFQALGRASTCWESMEGTGIFQSDDAKDVGDTLVAFIREYGLDGLPRADHDLPMEPEARRWRPASATVPSSEAGS